MYEVIYFVADSVVAHKALVSAFNEVLVLGLIRQHEKHAKITVVTCNKVPDNAVYKVF